MAKYNGEKGKGKSVIDLTASSLARRTKGNNRGAVLHSFDEGASAVAAAPERRTDHVGEGI